MNQQLKDYIEKKRAAGATDEQISTNLIAAGWASDMVHAALQANEQIDVPPPPPPVMPVTQSSPVVEPQRQTVTLPESSVQSSGYAAQYVIMLLSLWIGAVSLTQLLRYAVGVFGPDDDLVEVTSIFNIIWSAALIITLPIVTFLFLRLKTREIKDSRLKQNGIRKFGVYAALVIAILAVLIQILWSVLAMSNGGNIFGLVTDITITLLVTGPIIGYYLHDVWKAK